MVNSEASATMLFGVVVGDPSRTKIGTPQYKCVFGTHLCRKYPEIEKSKFNSRVKVSGIRARISLGI
jgi:hypothetical protein